MKSYNVILMRGLAGEKYSTGLDVLALKIKKLPGADYVAVTGYASRHVWARAIGSFKDPTAIVGHSYGANAALEMAREYPSLSIPMIVSFDPSRYWSMGTFFGGREIVPQNVKTIRNYYQRQDWPIKGVPCYREDGSTRGIINLLTRDEHVDIEDHPDYHETVLDDLRSLAD